MRRLVVYVILVWDASEEVGAGWWGGVPQGGVVQGIVFEGGGFVLEAGGDGKVGMAGSQK